MDLFPTVGDLAAASEEAVTVQEVYNTEAVLVAEQLIGLGKVRVGLVQVDRLLLERRHLLLGFLDVLLQVLDALGGGRSAERGFAT